MWEQIKQKNKERNSGKRKEKIEVGREREGKKKGMLIIQRSR